MEDINNNLLPEMNLEMDEQSKKELAETAKWTRFVSITMFVLAGVILLAGMLGSTLFSTVFDRLGTSYSGLIGDAGGVIMLVVAFVVLVIAVIYYFLFAFSLKINRALRHGSMEEYSGALKMLRGFFIATTVIGIIGLLGGISKLF